MKCPDCHRQLRPGYGGPVCPECRILWVDDPEAWEVRERD